MFLYFFGKHVSVEFNKVCCSVYVMDELALRMRNRFPNVTVAGSYATALQKNQKNEMFNMFGGKNVMGICSYIITEKKKAPSKLSSA